MRSTEEICDELQGMRYQERFDRIPPYEQVLIAHLPRTQARRFTLLVGDWHEGQKMLRQVEEAHAAVRRHASERPTERMQEVLRAYDWLLGINGLVTRAVDDEEDVEKMVRCECTDDS